MSNNDDYDDEQPHATTTHYDKTTTTCNDQTMRTQKKGTMRTYKEGTTWTQQEGMTMSPHNENDKTTNSNEAKHPFLLLLQSPPLSPSPSVLPFH